MIEVDARTLICGTSSPSNVANIYPVAVKASLNTLKHKYVCCSNLWGPKSIIYSRGALQSLRREPLATILTTVCTPYAYQNGQVKWQTFQTN